ncbi:hypothetical protein LEN26_009635 [Aphanomyces euteiches]|nr:hypothetical protein AeMF1_016455 [Aphanomyces euteiches]KAH9124930.1 hypothetical protein LEN26_009635 [Aphanomyces euteiches]KAH9184613.1 hypothetical protein AeNC1_013411 [Aphanomyces euteiches]
MARPYALFVVEWWHCICEFCTMEFAAATFPEASVSQDLTKPIVATAAFDAGHVIFGEVATVASAGSGLEDDLHDEGCEDQDCGGCAAVDDEFDSGLDDDDKEELSPYVVEHFDEIMATCEPFEPLASTEVRKNLFKILKSTDLRAPFLALPSDIKAGALGAAVAIRAAHPDAIPSDLTDDHVAQLIGILAKHSIPLEEINGSGLFLYVPKIQHSCTPNASYTDAGDAIWLTAIRPIAAGDVITVDFFDVFYTPVGEKKEVFADEGETCLCDVCQSVVADKTRAFKCAACQSGIVHPTKSVFACASCGAQWDADAIAAAEKEEANLMADAKVDTFDQLDKIVASSKLHAFHHIFFSILDVLVEDSVESAGSEEQALAAMYQQVEALEYVVPYPHAEKVSLFDSIAQANIALNAISKATEAYTHAYDVAKIVFGPEAKTTQLFERLKDKTPTTIADIPAAYGLQLFDDDE